jgi:hypothetical protein
MRDKMVEEDEDAEYYTLFKCFALDQSYSRELITQKGSQVEDLSDQRFFLHQLHAYNWNHKN